MSVKLEKILVLDDDPHVLGAISAFLTSEGYEVLSYGSIAEAREAIHKHSLDLVLADLLMSGGDLSLNFLRELRKLRPKLPIIIFTGHGSMDTAIEAIKMGVFDYLLKPVNPEELRITLNRLESIEQIKAENTYLRQNAAKTREQNPSIWGNSPAITEVLRLIEAASHNEEPVLIFGESGSGKESVARAIAEKSPRSARPFVRLNCATLSETALEVELFGEESAPTSDQEGRKLGCIEMADGGILFLEEISELPLLLQDKLRRVIQEKQTFRKGGAKAFPVNIRLMASTIKHLKQLVESGKFRDDLYYTLQIFSIAMPPLRDRGEDVFVIAADFLEKIMRKHGKKTTGLTPESRKKMTDYAWPGNVRELFNVLERALILAAPGAGIAPEDLALQGAPRSGLTLMNNGLLPTIDDMERRLIGLMLKQTDNNKSRAAKNLGISIRTMRNKLLKYKQEGIDVDNPDSFLKA